MNIKNQNKYELFEYIGIFLITLSVCFLVLVMIGERIVVDGNSMYPTLEDGQNIIMDKITYKNKNPKRFDIVIFYSPENKHKFLIKRVIGLPNETVIINKDGVILIKKEGIDSFIALDENYGYEQMEDVGLAENAIVLNADEYFVLGDNRNNSLDSRFEEVGNVSKKRILGKAYFRFTPIDKIGELNK